MTVRSSRKTWERCIEALGSVVLVLTCAGVIVEADRSMTDEGGAAETLIADDRGVDEPGTVPGNPSDHESR